MIWVPSADHSVVYQSCSTAIAPAGPPPLHRRLRCRVIMGDDEPALIRLWREKRGEIEPQDLSGNLIVQLGVATEPLNRLWYEHRQDDQGRPVTPSACAGRQGRLSPWLHKSEPAAGGLRLFFLRSGDHARFLAGFFSRTPGPPPLSSMNSMPAASKARRTAKSFGAVIKVSGSVSSARLIGATVYIAKSPKFA